MHSTDIAAYVHRANLYCPSCIALLFGHEAGAYHDAENVLDRVAHSRGIDRNDEYSFDTDDFPKVALADSLNADDYCGACHKQLIE